MNFSRFFLTLLVALVIAGHASAQNNITSLSPAGEDTPLVELSIIPEYTTLKPDSSMWIAVKQKIRPHWHTYWKNPGDSGAAPIIDWVLPKDFEVSETSWPVPDKIPYGPLLNYGYSDEVALLYKINIPQKSDISSLPLSMIAKVEVLVCEAECIPVYDTISYTFDNIVSPQNTAARNPEFKQPYIELLPDEFNGTASFTSDENTISLKFTDLPKDVLNSAKEISFFPDVWGVVENSAPSAFEVTGDNTLTLTQKSESTSDVQSIETISGVLKIKGEKDVHGLEFTAEKSYPPSKTAEKTQKSDKVKNTEVSSEAIEAHNSAVSSFNGGILGALLLAFIGGLILNLMPCVFPVLSLKVLSLVKLSEKNPSLARLHGVSYTAGVVISFLGIAALLIVLKAGGREIGWGFQLQDPLIVSLLAYLLFLIGLNLLGAFEFGTGLSRIGGRIGQKLSNGDGLRGSFFTGVLATCVATPCTAPFMAAAIGYALTSSSITALGIFGMLGFGLAFPYLLLAGVPTFRTHLPRPGVWMEKLKQFLAFPMFASCAWLIWVLSIQAGTSGLMSILCGLLLLGFAVWLSTHKPHEKKWLILAKSLMIISISLALFIIPRTSENVTQDVQATTKVRKFGEVYTPEALQKALETDDPVFIEMTAAWCITCKVNHKIAINVEETKSLFADMNMRYFVGDWTNQDPDITKFLETYGRSGVPIYVFYGRRDATSGERPPPHVLPQILTPQIVRNAVTKVRN